MDFLNGKIKTLYFKYLAAAFGSALITSIYSIVDMAMVGQYHGPEGTAALAVVAPIWNIIHSLGLLMGIGGSVLFSTIRGKGEGGRADPSVQRIFYRFHHRLNYPCSDLMGCYRFFLTSRCCNFSVRREIP